MRDRARRRACGPNDLGAGVFLAANLEDRDPSRPCARCRARMWKSVRSTIGQWVRLSMARGEA